MREKLERKPECKCLGTYVDGSLHLIYSAFETTLSSIDTAQRRILRAIYFLKK